MRAAASFMLGLLHLLLWFKDQRSHVYLLSVLIAFSAGAGAMTELALMHAQSIDAYRVLLRWENLFVFTLLVPMVWFVRARLPTARGFASLCRWPSRSGATTDLEEVVYVVDDDPFVRKGLARLLRSAGLAAETSASAAEFLGQGCSDSGVGWAKRSVPIFPVIPNRYLASPRVSHAPNRGIEPLSNATAERSMGPIRGCLQ